jgi:hypothetical protein
MIEAEEGSELTPARALASWIVAMIAEAVTGPTPGMVINRLAVSSALTDAASSLSIAPIASSSASPTCPRDAMGETARSRRSPSAVQQKRRHDPDAPCPIRRFKVANRRPGAAGQIVSTAECCSMSSTHRFPKSPKQRCRSTPRRSCTRAGPTSIVTTVGRSSSRCRASSKPFEDGNLVRAKAGDVYSESIGKIIAATTRRHNSLSVRGVLCHRAGPPTT